MSSMNDKHLKNGCSGGMTVSNRIVPCHQFFEAVCAVDQTRSQSITTCNKKRYGTYDSKITGKLYRNFIIEYLKSTDVFWTCSKFSSDLMLE